MSPELKLAGEILVGALFVIGLVVTVYRLPFVNNKQWNQKNKQVDEKLKEVDKRLDRGSKEFKEVHEDIGEIKTSVAVIEVKTTNTETLVEGLSKKFDDYHSEVKKMNGRK